MGPDQKLFIGPYMPTLYSLLDRKSPLWNLYMFYPSSDPKQKEMIDLLSAKNVDWALVVDMPIDGKEKYLLRNTHPLLWEHFNTAFRKLRAPALPKNHHLFRRMP